MAKKKKTSENESKLKIVEHNFASRPLVQVDSEGDTFQITSAVQGSMVKFVPTIAASKRSAFNAAEVREAFMNAGAHSVIIAPKIVAESTIAAPKREVAKAETMPEAFDAWMKSVAGVSDSIKLQCAALFDAICGKVGAK